MVLLASAILLYGCNNKNDDAELAPPLNNSGTMTVSSVGENSFLIKYVTRNVNSNEVKRISGTPQWSEMKILDENNQNVLEQQIYPAVVTEYRLAPNETLVVERRWNGVGYSGVNVAPGVYRIVCTDIFYGSAKIDSIEVLQVAIAMK